MKETGFSVSFYLNLPTRPKKLDLKFPNNAILT